MRLFMNNLHQRSVHDDGIITQNVKKRVVEEAVVQASNRTILKKYTDIVSKSINNEIKLEVLKDLMIFVLLICISKINCLH